jgi:hypothetical protein
VRLGGLGDKKQGCGSKKDYKLQELNPKNMNKNMLKKMTGIKIRIYPVPLEKTGNGRKQRDDLWSVANASNDLIELSNLSTGHSKQIGMDQVKEYRAVPLSGSKGLLLLRSQLTIDGKKVLVEPIR